MEEDYRCDEGSMRCIKQALKPNQTKLLSLLLEEFAQIRTRNPRYSMRAFSKKLDLPVSTLSGVLNQKLPITRKTAEKILRGLDADSKTASMLLHGLKYREDNRPSWQALKTDPYSPLNMDQFHLISTWYYLAVLHLAETEGFQDTPEWIAKTLGIQKREAKDALVRLEKLNLLVLNAAGKLVPSGQYFKTSNGIPSVYIRKNHLESLDLARRAMEEDEFSSCDFSGITMAIDPSRIPEAKKFITEFRRALCVRLESGVKKEVYRMSIQLFPLSNRKKFSKNTKNERVDNVQN